MPLFFIKVTIFIMIVSGTHENQIYVQQSVRLREEVQGTLRTASNKDSSMSMPRVRWHPYIATG